MKTHTTNQQLAVEHFVFPVVSFPLPDNDHEKRQRSIFEGYQHTGDKTPSGSLLPAPPVAQPTDSQILDSPMP